MPTTIGLWYVCDCPPYPFCTHSVCVALDQLQKADLITSEEVTQLKAGFNEEKRKLANFSDVIEVQSGKSPAVIMKSASVLRKHGFDNVARVLEGKFIFCLCCHCSLCAWTCCVV